MTGYWNRPEETREAIDAEGWLHTGDIGRIDDAGFLRITDRKKDLLVTAGGKNVAPQRIESLLARSALVQRAVVLGDRRPYLVALIVPDYDAIRALDDEPELAGLQASLLADHPRVREMLQALVDETNAQLASFETIKRFAVLSRDLSIENGELTPTGKVRRRKIDERHGERLARLYE
jgi:long-chain acyl-CoA synthetase